MDHVMLKIEQYYDIYLDDFIEEQLKHNHKTLKENPIYPELKLLSDSINLYREYLDLPKIDIKTDVEAVLKGV